MLSIDSRTNEFQSRLEELVRFDEHLGAGRFFQYVGSLAIAHQVGVALGRKYDLDSEQVILPFPVLIAGESASGKTTLSTTWNDTLNRLGREKYLTSRDGPWSQCISLDNYYHDNSLQRAEYSDLGGFYRNFDVDNPGALNMELAAHHIKLLSQGQAVMLPVHDIATGVSTMDAVQVKPTPFVVIEGLFALHSQLADIGNQACLRVFVDVPRPQLRRRWFTRIEQMSETANWKVPEAERPFYFDRVAGAAEKYVLPTKKYADIIVNGETAEDHRNRTVARLSEIMADALCFPL